MNESNQDKPNRRDFISISAGIFGLGGVAAFSWPVFGNLAPAADVNVPRRLRIDLSKIEPGQQVKVLAYGEPVIIRHRTEAEIEAAANVDLSDLRHPQTDQDRLRRDHNGNLNPKFLIVNPTCTHFGCITVPESGDFNGFYCPCHGAHFDTSGRVRKGPPPTNLVVPNYRYISDSLIEILPLHSHWIGV